MKVKWLMGITLWGTLKFRKFLFCFSISTVYKDKKCHCVSTTHSILMIKTPTEFIVNYYNMLIIIKLFWCLLLFFLSFISLITITEQLNTTLSWTLFRKSRTLLSENPLILNWFLKGDSLHEYLTIVNVLQQTNR